MNYGVPGMKRVTQDKGWSCWFVSAQMIIRWRRRRVKMTEVAHPGPSQVRRWNAAYDLDPGLLNAPVPDVA